MLYLFGEFELSEEDFSLSRHGKRIALEPRALQVLLVLAGSNGKLLEKKALLEAVWKDTFVEETTLTRAVALIRKHLGDDPRAPKYIETVPTRGYRFIAGVEIRQSPDARPALAGATAAAEPAGPPELAVPSPVSGPDVLNHAALAPPRRAFWIYVAVALLLITGGLAVILRHGFHRAPPLTTRDTLLLGDFANTSGDPVFDETLRQGMLVQLEQSPVLRLASDGQVRKTLRLMGLNPEVRLTPEVSREVCQRIGGTVVLNGSIVRLGKEFVIGLRARECSTGEELDAEQVQIARKEDVLNALSQIATRFRTRIGEASATIKELDTPLAEATTPSLDALRAFSQAIRTFNTKGSSAAEPLFQKATELDPQFAAAHVWLGRMHADLGEETSAIESTQRAYALRERASDRERFSIDVSYDLLVTGNLEKALAACDAWIQMYPRDVYARTFLSGMVYPAYGQYEKALAEAEGAIAIDPDFVVGYRNAAINLIAMNRLSEAEAVLQQAAQRKLFLPSFVTDTYRIAFLKGDTGGMERALRAAPANPWLLHYGAATLARDGHLPEARRLQEEAVRLARRAARPEMEAQLLVTAALTDLFYGFPNDATRQVREALRLSTGRNVEYTAGLVLAMAGEPEEATRLVNDLRRRFPEDTLVRYNYLPTIQAAVSLAHKRPQQALDLLGDTAQFGVSLPLYPTYLRGQALLALGQASQASAEFGKIVAHPGLVMNDPLLNVVQVNLARADALAGDKEHARVVYDAVLQRWSGEGFVCPALRQARLERSLL